MSWVAPQSAELRSTVRFERRAGQGNRGGVVKSEWQPIVSARRARLLPLRGGEVVQAARLAGQSAWELVIPFDRALAGLTTDDRAVDARDPARVFDIRSILDLEGRSRWLVMTLEQGTADGRAGT